MVFIGGFLQVTKIKLDKKIDIIKNQLSKEKELEYRKKINKLQEFQTQIEIEKNIIRDFELISRIKFSGEWNIPPYLSTNYVLVEDRNSYVILQGENPDLSIKFYTTETYQFHTITNKSAIFETRQAVKKDVFPIGNSINELFSFDKIIFQIPLIGCQNIKDGNIIIEQVEIIFIINSKQHNYTYNPQLELPIENCEGAAFLTTFPPDTLKNVLAPK